MGLTPRSQYNAQLDGSGREELRATLLKPYLLRMRDERGEAAVRALLSKVGLPQQILDDETTWISAAAAARALNGLTTALGDDAVKNPGSWMTHPETLGAYVRLLRVASEPLDAYRYLTAHSTESTRIGTYQLQVLASDSVRIRYEPRREVETEQGDRMLCRAREAELSNITRLWGLEPAEVQQEACLADGSSHCSYVVHWRLPRANNVPLGVGLGAIASGGAVALSGSWPAASIAALVGAGLGGLAGFLTRRVSQERMQRVFEKHRILALERGLALRGQLDDNAEFTGATLGGKYRVVRSLARGGFGAVYEAEHVTLSSHVAIKVLRGAAAMDAAEIARLRREARVQVSIEHPNVVRTLDLDQMPDGSIYVVMELLRGESLAERLRKQRPLPPAMAVPIFVQVCRALSAAHRLGIIHRDLKPANVFLCAEDHVKVLDFGMSKFAEAETLTRDGYTLGTPEYMAPEQCVGAQVEPRSDLYSLGAVMYESFTGDPPFWGRSRHELLELQQREVPEPMRIRRPDLDLPEELDDLVMSCLRKRAAERPQSARTLEKALTKVAQDRLVAEYPEGTPRRGSRRRLDDPKRYP